LRPIDAKIIWVTVTGGIDNDFQLFSLREGALWMSIFLEKLHADLSCDPATKSPARFSRELWQTAGSDIRIET